MSWRRFGIVLSHLPSESAYLTAVRNATDLSSLPEPDSHGPWTQEGLLMAGIFDRLGTLIKATTGDQTPLVPYPRPGVLSNVRPINPSAQAYLRYLAEHHGAAPPDGWKPEVV